MVAGREATPKDVANTERLKAYWAEGAGAARIRWGVPQPGDFDRCRRLIQKEVTEDGHAPLAPNVINGLCANLHKRATGAAPGHAPGEEAAHAAKNAAKRAAH